MNLPSRAVPVGIRIQWILYTLFTSHMRNAPMRLERKFFYTRMKFVGQLTPNMVECPEIAVEWPSMKKKTDIIVVTVTYTCFAGEDEARAWRNDFQWLEYFMFRKKSAIQRKCELMVGAKMCLLLNYDNSKTIFSHLFLFMMGSVVSIEAPSYFGRNIALVWGRGI